MIKALEALVQIDFLFIKRGEILSKDNSKPIRFKTVQKNKKLGEFVIEENNGINPEEQNQID